MSKEKKENVRLTVKISNFKGRKRCPYCNSKVDEMDWSDEGLRIWCRSENCGGKGYKIFTPIDGGELDLVKMTHRAIGEWNEYCINVGRRMKNEQRV